MTFYVNTGVCSILCWYFIPNLSGYWQMEKKKNKTNKEKKKLFIEAMLMKYGTLLHFLKRFRSFDYQSLNQYAIFFSVSCSDLSLCRSELICDVTVCVWSSGGLWCGAKYFYSLSLMPNSSCLMWNSNPEHLITQNYNHMQTQQLPATLYNKGQN